MSCIEHKLKFAIVLKTWTGRSGHLHYCLMVTLLMIVLLYYDFKYTFFIGLQSEAFNLVIVLRFDNLNPIFKFKITWNKWYAENDSL